MKYITCKEQVDFIMDYVTGELPAAELHEFERHLKVCPACIAYLDTYREAVRLGKEAMAEIEQIMRSRHGLKLDDPNDFNLETQDQFLKLWEQISRATFFALVVISSIALMVGGIGVMAIMSISVTERTREIGVRKALGARRAEILFQFLMEAAFLTSLGGVLGIIIGSAIGWIAHAATGFPICCWH